MLSAYDKAIKVAKKYVENPKNKDMNGNFKRLNKDKINTIVNSINDTLEDNDLQTYDHEKLVENLENVFNEYGLYGKNEIYQSPSLTKIRSELERSCMKVIGAKDVIFKNGFLFFNCRNNKVGSIAKTKLNVKKATAGMFFDKSEDANRALTWEDIKEAKEIANPVESLKPVQATTKK